MHGGAAAGTGLGLGRFEGGNIGAFGIRDGAIDALAQEFRVTVVADHGGKRVVGTRPDRDR